MLWPESETVAAKLPRFQPTISLVDRILADNAGSMVTLSHLQLFAGGNSAVLRRVLDEYVNLRIIAQVAVVSCPEHPDVFEVADKDRRQLYCDHCEQPVDATTWVDAVAFRVIKREFSNKAQDEQADQAGRFQIAFSFPGEHRDFVRSIAKSLLKKGLSKSTILFDEFHTAEFARPNLDTHLQDLYFNQSRLVVVCLCEAYDQSQWCGLECRAIRTMIKQHRDDQLMFIRLDAGDVKGIFEIDGYVDANGKSATEIAELIQQRLALDVG